MVLLMVSGCSVPSLSLLCTPASIKVGFICCFFQTFGEYLETSVLDVNGSSHLVVTDQFPVLFEELFLILGVILLVAILASVAVFCCSIGVRRRQHMYF